MLIALDDIPEKVLATKHRLLQDLFIPSDPERAAVCTHTDRMHPIPIDVFVRLVLSLIRRAEAVVSRRSPSMILHKT
jgi:hypothetical protein